MKSSFAKYLCPKVFVVGDENTMFRKGAVDCLIATDSSCLLINRGNIVTFIPQPTDTGRAGACIDEETR